jgi:hypothetical protein
VGAVFAALACTGTCRAARRAFSSASTSSSTGSRSTASSTGFAAGACAAGAGALAHAIKVLKAQHARRVRATVAILEPTPRHPTSTRNAISGEDTASGVEFGSATACAQSLKNTFSVAGLHVLLSDLAAPVRCRSRDARYRARRPSSRCGAAFPATTAAGASCPLFTIHRINNHAAASQPTICE